MPEEPEPKSEEKAPEPAAETVEPEGDDVGDFITRNVLEKDSVFFEG